MMVVLFDGVCNLCNGAVDWIITRDRNNRFRFASLQSDYGRQVIEKYELTSDYLNTIVLVEDDKVYLRAPAVLRILKHLGGVYSVLYIFNALPSSILNFFYNIVAKYRYGWFGKRDTCRVPDAKAGLISLMRPASVSPPTSLPPATPRRSLCASGARRSTAAATG